MGRKQINEPHILIYAQIKVKNIYPLCNHQIGYDKNTDKNYVNRLDCITESIKKHGVLNPMILHNKKDDGTYEVSIGNSRLFGAIHADIEKVPALVNCLVNQKFIPEGIRIYDTNEVHEYFTDDAPIALESICVEKDQFYCNPKYTDEWWWTKIKR